MNRPPQNINNLYEYLLLDGKIVADGDNFSRWVGPQIHRQWLMAR